MVDQDDRASQSGETRLDIPDPAQMSPADALRLVDEFVAKPEYKKGINLQLHNADGSTRKSSNYTKTDRYNLTLIFEAAKARGLRVANEAEIQKNIAPLSFLRRPDSRNSAKAAWDGFVKNGLPEFLKTEAAETVSSDSKEALAFHEKRKPDIEDAQIVNNFTSEELAKIFDMPAGDMLEKLGFITSQQVFESGEKQTSMLTIKLAIQDGSLQEQDAIAAGFKNRDGKLDLFPIIFMDAGQFNEFLSKYDLSRQFVTARSIVKSRSGVNQKGDTIFVPPMGVIHEKLKFYTPEMKAASLTIQQSIRASETALRLSSGNANPELHAKKAEFNFDNSKDDPRLQAIQNFHKELSTVESRTTQAFETVILKPEQMQKIATGFEDAAQMFESANQREIAEQVRRVATLYAARLNIAPSASAPSVDLS